MGAAARGARRDCGAGQHASPTPQNAQLLVAYFWGGASRCSGPDRHGLNAARDDGRYEPGVPTTTLAEIIAGTPLAIPHSDGGGARTVPLRAAVHPAATIDEDMPGCRVSAGADRRITP